MSFNQATLIGNLGKDPDLRFTGSGKAVCNFSIATSSSWVDNDGKKQERVEWHNIKVWGKQGESCAKYLSKGRQVLVVGEIRTRSYDDRDGNKRYITEIIAQNVRFLGGGKRDEEGTDRHTASEPDGDPALGDDDSIQF